MNGEPRLTVPRLFLLNYKTLSLGVACVALFQFLLNRIDWLVRAAVNKLYAAGGDPAAALRPALIMIALGLLAFGVRVASRFFLYTSGFDVAHQLRARILRTLHAKGPSFFRRVATGNIMNVTMNDAMQVRVMFMQGFVLAVNLVFAVASSLQVMLKISLQLSLVSLSIAPIIAILSVVFARRTIEATRANQGSLDKLSSLAQRHFSGIRLVRSFAIEPFVESRFAEATDELVGSSTKLARLRGAIAPTLSTVNAAGLLGVVLYGAVLLKRGPAHGGLTEGDFVAYLIAGARMALMLAMTGYMLGVVQRGRACLGRIHALIDSRGDLPATRPRSQVGPAQTTAALSVRGLSFRDGEKQILSDISFELPDGKSLAIVGRTGAGKSTLAMLLARLLPTPPGAVFLDGVDITELENARLRARVGYAQQDPFLFSSSVAENVALSHATIGSSEASAEATAAVLRDVRIADEVEALPHGVNTEVGERGIQLSGGQRQRIALARALLSTTPLLVLDDPLSAVDARTEAAIASSLRERSQARSLVFITHRMSLAASCDQVLVLDGGRVVQAGPPATLAAEGKLYAELVAEQHADADSALDQPTETTTPARAPRGVAPRHAAREQGGLGAGDLRLLARIWPSLVAQRGLLIGALTLLGVAALTSVLRPMAIARITSSAIADQPLLLPAVVLAVVLTANQLFGFAQSYLTQMAGVRSMRELRMRLFRHSNRVGSRYFDRASVGRMVALLVSDVESISELFASGAVNSVGELIALTGIVATMLALNWQLSLIAFSAAPLTVLWVILARRITKPAHREVQQLSARMTSFFHEQVTGATVIQAFGYERAMTAEFEAISRRGGTMLRRALVAESSIDASVEMMQTVCMASVLLWASHVGPGAGVTFAVIVMFQQYLRQFFDPVSNLAQRTTALQMALASADRIFEFVDVPEEEDTVDPAGSPEASNTSMLSLRDVDFSYRRGEPILNQVSLEARPGERIAIVGRTGAGKSTIAQLLLRLYDADRGTVLVEGRDVRTWSRQALRQRFAVVPQEVMLFSGSLLDNIALGDASPDRARAEHALETLGIAEIFSSRPGGLDTRVDERGLNYSVGERQLIAFARAVYRDAPILLLDEATAAVDSRTEARLQNALGKLLVGRTALVIAHRMSTIESADRIVVIEAGRIVESGSHDELLARGGLYARMHALQVKRAEHAPPPG